MTRPAIDPTIIARIMQEPEVVAHEAARILIDGRDPAAFRDARSRLAAMLPDHLDERDFISRAAHSIGLQSAIAGEF